MGNDNRGDNVRDWVDHGQGFQRDQLAGARYGENGGHQVIAILAAISAFFQSIPALAAIGKLLDKWLEQWKAKDVQKRKADKDAEVDAAIDSVVRSDGVYPSQPEQQPSPDATT